MKLEFELAKSQLLESLRDMTRRPSAAKSTPTTAAQTTAAIEATSDVSFTEAAEQTSQLLQQWMTLFRQESLRPLMQLLQRAPELGHPLLALATALRDLHANDQEMRAATDWLEALAQFVDTPEHAEGPAPHFGAAQRATQWLGKATALLTSQASVPPQARATTGEVLRFLATSLHESPLTFEQELFALPVAQQAGLTPTELQTLSHHVEPMRLALLLIAARRADRPHDPDTTRSLTAGLRQAIQQEQSALLVVESWEAQLHPTQLKNFDPSKLATVHTLAEGATVVSEHDEAALWLQALSIKHGVLPDTAWQLEAGEVHPESGAPATVSARDAALQGALFYTTHFPIGLHRLHFRVHDDEADTEGLAEFLLYVVREYGAEEKPPSQQHPPPQQQPHGNPYQQHALAPPTPTPLLGTIAVRLNTPFILTTPYQHDRTIAAPLQVAFHFLADQVAPATRFSRRDFLTLAESPEAGQFRAAVRALAQQGIGGFDRYLDALQGLFTRLESTLPGSATTLERAKHYLRNEVLLYLVGKRGAGTSVTTPIVAGTSRGDVLASVLCTTAGVMAAAEHTADALVHFASAAELATTKPYFLNRLEEFFRALRHRLPATTPGPAEAAALLGTLPILPPGPGFRPARGLTTPKAALFAQYLRVQDRADENTQHGNQADSRNFSRS
ncbi:MAG: hypothetical protein HY696_04695 [Deltaproteobacteria bacterium]|nr:hypothetical protein [Deltaproteobacteria bacterium]